MNQTPPCAIGRIKGLSYGFNCETRPVNKDDCPCLGLKLSAQSSLLTKDYVCRHCGKPEDTQSCSVGGCPLGADV